MNKEHAEQEFACPACGQTHRGEQQTQCPACGAGLHVAKLNCTVSPGTGAAVGDSWLLFPREYDIGRQEGNDLVMGDQFVSRHHLKLIFMDGSFYAKNMATNRDENEPEFCKIENEDFLSVGTGRLKLEYLLPEVQISLDALRIALAGIYEMQFAKNVPDACRELLRGFLRITELEKAYVFSLRHGGDEIQLTELASQAADSQPLPPQDYRISQTSLRQVLGYRGEPLIYSDDLKATPTSSSIAQFRLKSIVCVPLLNDNDETIGIIYGDSRRLTTHHLTQFKPALVLIARLLMRRLGELGYALS